MKYTLLFFFAIAMGVSQAQQTVEAPITDVTVFLSQAQVTRKANVQLSAGEHQIVIEGISSRINRNSVVVKGNDAFTILGVKHENVFNQADGSNPRIAQLDEQIADKEFERRTKQSVQAVYREEMEFIKANRNIVGEEGVLAEDIEEMANFWRERVREIEFRKLELDVEIVELNTELNKLYQERSKQIGFGGQNQGQVTISLSMNKAGKVPIELTYVAYDAGWMPNYDVRTAGTSENVQLSYKGKVYQSTGNDWDNVKLTLSSGNPALSGTPPEFYPWRVRPLEYRSDKLNGDPDGRAQPAPVTYDLEEDVEVVEELSMENGFIGNAPLVSVTQGTVNTEFNIAVPYTIPSDNQKVDVECQQITLQSKYYHYTAPRGSQSAYLMADITNWLQHNLLDGQANIYLNGTFTGTSSINASAGEDTLKLSLGQDPGVVVSRELLTAFCSTKSFGGKKETSKGFETSILNTKSTSVEIELVEQIPVSTDNRINVEVVELSGGKLDEETGKVTWNVTLQPGETLKKVIKFKVKYPKKVAVSGL